MKRWVVSDTHFNHANIIQYCDRPFADVEQMNKELIKRWNNTVAKDDIVYQLGDFAFGSKEQLITVYPMPDDIIIDDPTFPDNPVEDEWIILDGDVIVD